MTRQMAAVTSSTPVFLLYGKSATGKTSLARRLGRDLGIAFIGLDDIKEMMYDQGFNETDTDAAEALNQTCFYMLEAAVRGYVATHSSLIVDVHEQEDLQALCRAAVDCGAEVYPIHMIVSDEAVRVDRREQRILSGERHSGHKLDLPPKASQDMQPWHTVDTITFSDEIYVSLRDAIGRILLA